MWTSGTSVSARLPSLSPPARTSVPVSGGVFPRVAARARARISSRASFTAPPLPEGLLGKRLQVASLRPCSERARHTPCRSVAGAPELLRPLVKPRVPEDTSERAHCDPLRDVFLRLRAQMQQHARDVDLHGADLVAGAAQ